MPTLVDATGRPLAMVDGTSRDMRRPVDPVPAMPTTAATAWTYADAVAAVESAVYADLTREDYAANARLTDAHDPWGGGVDWMGPDGGGGEVWRLMRPGVERQFTPVDVLGEALGRVESGLLEREADFGFAPLVPEGKDGGPSAAQNTEAAAAVRAVTAWWDRVRFWEQAGRAAQRARALARGLLAVTVPVAYQVPVVRDGQTVRTLPSNLSLDAALARVQLAAPEPNAGAVVTDLATGHRVAVLRYTRTEGSGAGARAVNVAQVWVPQTGATAAALGVVTSYRVRDLPETRGGVASVAGDAADTAAAEYDLPITRLPLAEAAGRLLIHDAERRQQARLNLAESCVPRLIETAAFPERTYLNAQRTGLWVDGPPAWGADVIEVERDGHDNIVAHQLYVPLTIGAGTANFFVGVPTGAPDKATGVIPRATPGVHVKEPTPPDHLLASATHSRSTLLRSLRQGHVLNDTGAAASGYSLEQARADFLSDLRWAKSPVEALIRETIEAALAWALVMADGAEVQGDFLARFQCTVTLHVSAGPLSDTERAGVLSEYGAGLCSRETAVARLGSEDVAAEIARIDATPLARLKLLEQAATTMAAIALMPGATMDVAVRAFSWAGFDAGLVDALTPRDTDGVAAPAETTTETTAITAVERGQP